MAAILSRPQCVIWLGADLIGDFTNTMQNKDLDINRNQFSEESNVSIQQF